MSLAQKFWRNFVDIIGLNKVIITAIDISASFRQGWFFVFSHPFLWGRAFIRQVKAFGFEKYADLYEEKMLKDKYLAMGKKVGLFKTDWKGEFSTVFGKEERFQTRFAHKIPGIKRSERAYSIMLDTLRLETFKHYAKRLEELGVKFTDENMHIYRDLALSINAMTGRGNIGSILGRYAPVLNGNFFSPRFWYSRFEIPIRVATASPIVRKWLAWDLAKTFMGTGGIIALMYFMLKQKGIDVEIETDPASSDFLKLRVRQTRLDFLQGYSQIIRVLYQLATGKQKTITTKRTHYIKPATILGRYIQSKLAPTPGLVLDWARKRTFTGEPFKWLPEKFTVEEVTQSQIFKRLALLWTQDFLDAVKEYGWGKAIPFGGVSILGIGVQTYEMDDWQRAYAYKNEVALMKYGMDWDDLTIRQQNELYKENPVIEEWERRAKLSQKTVPPITETLEEQYRIGRKVFKELDKNVRNLIEQYGGQMKAIRRQIGRFYMNDERFNNYINYIKELLNTKFPLLPENKDLYKDWLAKFNAGTELDKAEMINDFIADVKRAARMRVVRDMIMEDRKNAK